MCRLHLGFGHLILSTDYRLPTLICNKGTSLSLPAPFYRLCIVLYVMNPKQFTYPDRLYREMRKLKEETAEAETVKRCIEQVIPPTEQRKEKSKTHDVSL